MKAAHLMAPRRKGGKELGPFYNQVPLSNSVNLGIDEWINICEVRALMISGHLPEANSQPCCTENTMPSAHEL